MSSTRRYEMVTTTQKCYFGDSYFLHRKQLISALAIVIQRRKSAQTLSYLLIQNLVSLCIPCVFRSIFLVTVCRSANMYISFCFLSRSNFTILFMVFCLLYHFHPIFHLFFSWLPYLTHFYAAVSAIDTLAVVRLA